MNPAIVTGMNAEREPEGEDEIERQQIGPVVTVDRQPRIAENGQRKHRQPGRHHGARTDLGHERLRDAGPERCRAGSRQERESCLQRRPAEHLLDVQREDEEVRVDRGAEEQPDAVRAGQRADAKDRRTGRVGRSRAAPRRRRRPGPRAARRAGRSSGRSPSRRPAPSRSRTRAARARR